MPEQVDRYKIGRLLGSGGFGRVYLGYDEVLQRSVAIKVWGRPHAEDADFPRHPLFQTRGPVRSDHPYLVRYLDAGSTDDGLDFVIMEFIDGPDLRRLLKQKRFSPTEAARIVATVAEALDYIHRQGLLHRRIKPANILIDSYGTPRLADFGLGLRNADFNKRPDQGIVGTARYMSPELALGAGHGIDGRADIFSLGIVFYELLTGDTPFRGNSYNELLHQIQTAEAWPPRQIDDNIPQELEQICLKAISKRAIDRYQTAADFAQDLNQFLERARLDKRGGTDSNVDLC